MSKNKTVLLLTIIASLLIITLPTILQIYQNHNNRLLQVATKKILESAESCFYDDVCQGNEITIGDLRDNGYLESDVVNPKTKKYFAEDTLLIYEEYHVHFAQEV